MVQRSMTRTAVSARDSESGIVPFSTRPCVKGGADGGRAESTASASSPACSSPQERSPTDMKAQGSRREHHFTWYLRSWFKRFQCGCEGVITGGRTWYPCLHLFVTSSPSLRATSSLLRPWETRHKHAPTPRRVTATQSSMFPGMDGGKGSSTHLQSTVVPFVELPSRSHIDPGLTASFQGEVRCHRRSLEHRAEHHVQPGVGRDRSTDPWTRAKGEDERRLGAGSSPMGFFVVATYSSPRDPRI